MCLFRTRAEDYEFVDLDTRDESNFAYYDVDLDQFCGPLKKKRPINGLYVTSAGRARVEWGWVAFVKEK